MIVSGPLASGVVEFHTLPLLVVVTLAAIGSAVLLGLAIGAFLQRRTGPYLLIAAAVSTLLGRSAIAGVSASGILAPSAHHLLEHGLDVILVALVIAAVYHSRTVTQEVDLDR